jgi:putative heme-binding domain-containing protein
MQTQPIFHPLKSEKNLAFSPVWFLLGLAFATPLVAQQSDRIWCRLSTDQQPAEVLFRKQFSLLRPEVAELQILSGSVLEIFLNDQQVGLSDSNDSTTDVSKLLVPGLNQIAVRVRAEGDTPGLNLRIRVLERGEDRWRVLGTNSTWKVATAEQPGWQLRTFADSDWKMAVGLPNLPGQTTPPATLNPPSKMATPVAPVSSNRKGMVAPPEEDSPKEEEPRFTLAENFKVEEVFSPEETGSLIAMEFNEFGKLLLSQEGGGLLLADLDRPQGHPQRLRVFCDQVTNCQGILALNGKVYVTGNGPQGLGLYQLSDTSRDGRADQVQRLLQFTGGPGEHGPHSIQLGLDGMLYVVLGNGTQLVEKVADSSPYRHWYEGDLVPRYEDPGGHAHGTKAPGGTLIRLSLDGSLVERVAGGIRNAYDFVFDDQGNLFVHDSDMESDEGAPWYRPNNIYHLPIGGELGWRSGWSNFPMHALDQVPAIGDTGRGSPTGAVFYQHLIFPSRYHDSIFLADWSEGQILVFKPKPEGAGFQSSPEVFLSGKPLNVCDLAVGEDGGLYFCTGGRGTSGGVFRVVWTGRVPQEFLKFDSDLVKVIRHPQPNSAWGRQSLAELKRKMGERWQITLEGVVSEVRNPSQFRCRALQLMLLYGTPPSAELLVRLATDKEAGVRAEVARICGLIQNPQTETVLSNLIVDSAPVVRRAAGEAFLRLPSHPELGSLKKMLNTSDRIEAGIARRLLERIPVEQWEVEFLQSEDLRVFFNSSLALMTADPNLNRSYQILARSSQILDGNVGEQDTVDLLRTIQLALIRGEVNPEKVPGLVERIGDQFPAGNSIVNQELARLMAFLKVDALGGRIQQYLKTESVPLNDRIHLAMHLQFIGQSLDPAVRLAIIECLESSSRDETSAGLKMYIKRAVEDVAKTMTPQERDIVLANGADWPNATIAAFYQLPSQLDDTTRQRIIELDQSLKSKTDAAANQLRLGVIALLARNGDYPSMEYLRKLWIEEVPRRGDLAIGLAQQPDERNWAYLVSSLPHLDDLTGKEIVQILKADERKPIDGEHFRNLIELGYRMRTNGALEAVKLLEIWGATAPDYSGPDWQSRLETWKNWLAETYPEEPPVQINALQPKGKYSVDQIVSYLEQNGLGDRHKGMEFFSSTQCANCHRVGNIGQNVGPDLTHLTQRFSLREIVEATIDPSASIPDRYRSKVVLTVDGDQHTGMAIAQSDGGLLILRSDGNRIKIAREDIEEIRESDVSAMPVGLLDELSLSQIADLMAFLTKHRDQMAQGVTGENR